MRDEWNEAANAFRVLVTGSRDWRDTQMIRDELAKLMRPNNFLTVVHGACDRGADLTADLWAREYAWVNERHPADWVGPCRPGCKPGHRRRNSYGGTYCPSAGHYRNQDMVDLGADVVLAFQRNGSRGTQDCIDRALAAGLKVVPHTEAS